MKFLSAAMNPRVKPVSSTVPIWRFCRTKARPVIPRWASRVKYLYSLEKRQKSKYRMTSTAPYTYKGYFSQKSTRTSIPVLSCNHTLSSSSTGTCVLYNSTCTCYYHKYCTSVVVLIVYKLLKNDKRVSTGWPVMRYTRTKDIFPTRTQPSQVYRYSLVPVLIVHVLLVVCTSS